MDTLSEKEQSLLTAVISNILGGDAALTKMIDWDTVQVVTNYKDVHITKMMFRRLLGKIKGTPGSSKTTAASASKPQGISKSTPSKGSRGRKQKPISDLIAAEEAGPEDVVQAVVPEEGYDGNTGSGAVAQDLDEGAKVDIKQEPSDLDKAELKDEVEE